jgi:hypothetical protein
VFVISSHLAAFGSGAATTSFAAASAIAKIPVPNAYQTGTLLKSDTYSPPDNGGPDSTQGSGTR